MKKKTIKKGITLDDLAVMTQGGFSEMNERFNEINKRFDDVEKRLNIIENKLITQHTIEIEHLRDKVMQHEVKLAKLSK